jgi:hypothetical protein
VYTPGRPPKFKMTRAEQIIPLNLLRKDLLALFCRSCFGLFQLVSAYSLSQNTIESTETNRLFHQPNQPVATNCLIIDSEVWFHKSSSEGLVRKLLQKNKSNL